MGGIEIGVVQNHNEVDWKYATSFKGADHLGERCKGHGASGVQ